MAHSVKVTDHGYKALQKRLKAASVPIYGTVGIHEAEGAAEEADGTTVLDVAGFMEFGTEHIPPRSFIGDYFDENLEKNRTRVRNTAKAVVKGTLSSMEVGMNRLGLQIVGEIQARIRDGLSPELKESTVEAKGSSTPLIDTGQLWSSIRHKIVKGDL